MIQTLIRLDEYEEVEMHYNSAFMDFEQLFTYEETSDGTIVTSDAKVIGKNIMMRSVFAIMEGLMGSFSKQEMKNIEALKVIIEENRTDYFLKNG